MFDSNDGKDYADGAVVRAKKLESDTLVVAIDNFVTSLFESPKVGLLINRIFWDTLRERSLSYYYGTLLKAFNPDPEGKISSNNNVECYYQSG